MPLNNISFNSQIAGKIFEFMKDKSNTGVALSSSEIKTLRTMLETEAAKHHGKIPYSVRDTFDDAATRNVDLLFVTNKASKEFTDLVKWMDGNLYDPLLELSGKGPCK